MSEREFRKQERVIGTNQTRLLFITTTKYTYQSDDVKEMFSFRIKLDSKKVLLCSVGQVEKNKEYLLDV